MNRSFPSASSKLLGDELERLLCAGVTRYAGVRLAETSQNMIENRLLKFMAPRGLTDPEALVRQACARPDSGLAQSLFQAMLNAETSFFRDPAMFAELRERWVPSLMAARASERRLTIWSAACSTGQEPYSLVMVLATLFPALLDDWTVEIVATDINRANLDRATTGVFTKLEVNRGLPAAMLTRWMSKTELGWKVADRLRARIEFRQLNLLTDWPPLPRFDLVLLRNVMIYWEHDVRRTLVDRLAGVVTEHGYLVLGGAELLPPEAPFKLEHGQRWPSYRPAR